MYLSEHSNFTMQTEKNLIETQLSGAQQRIDNLYYSSKQTTNYRHDLRHHMSLLSSMIDQEDYAQAKDYISHLHQDVLNVSPITYCNNEIVNLIFSHYTAKANENDIQFIIHADIPNEINLSDTELCSILSNGLENALHANKEIKDATQRKLCVDCGIDSNVFLLEIRNSYTGEIRTKNGIPYSIEEGHGYGCQSIASIANKRNGHCCFKMNNGIFTLQVGIPL